MIFLFIETHQCTHTFKLWKLRSPGNIRLSCGVHCLFPAWLPPDRLINVFNKHKWRYNSAVGSGHLAITDSCECVLGLWTQAGILKDNSCILWSHQRCLTIGTEHSPLWLLLLSDIWLPAEHRTADKRGNLMAFTSPAQSRSARRLCTGCTVMDRRASPLLVWISG